jgi:type VI secretion system protein ImpM
MSIPVAPGLYGKLPIVGDFVSRRLPASFIQRWDTWLQEALSASREQLGAEWLEVYLTSPIWRFVLSSGNCGDDASAGILMPSVDKVGRYFPLTLAAMLHTSEAIPHLFVTAANWFDTLEQLALHALEGDVNLDAFDSKLQNQFLTLPLSPSRKPNSGSRHDRDNSDLVFSTEMEKLELMPEALLEMSACLLARFFPAYSLWSTTGSEKMKPSFLVYSGLPPAKAFSGLLTGEWQRYEGSGPYIDSISLLKIDPIEAIGAARARAANDGTSIKWISHACSTVGKVRDLNEDAYLENPEIGLWAVADGMGGHLAGDEASKAVVDALRFICASDTLGDFSANVTECLRKTNTELLKRAQEKKQNQIMGTTVVVMLAVGKHCASIWAGDSRLYRYRSGLLSQLTRDHSLISEMSRPGLPSSDALTGKAFSNIVTRALGAAPELAVDIIAFEAKPSDTYLLCSDGLVKELNPHEIAEILSQLDCNKSSQALIDLALARGARDNVTVIVVTAEGESKSSEKSTGMQAV